MPRIGTGEGTLRGTGSQGRADSNPNTLIRPYSFLGLDLLTSVDSTHATATCPFCGREGKFSIALSSGLWRCLVCNEGTEKGGGNIYTFLRLLWDQSDKATEDYSEISEDRKLLYPETLMHWGICRSTLTNEWLVPGYGIDGKMNQLYRYIRDIKTGKMLLLATPGLHHQLFGIPLLKKDTRDIYVCEGPWDAIALWECMRGSKRFLVNRAAGVSAGGSISDSGLILTSSESASLLGNASVIGVPGCNVFLESWLPLFANKRVFLMFDSDHPRITHGKTFTAGYDGMKRVSQILSRAEQPPSEIHFLKWGDKGYDSKLPSGYDVRDFLSTAGDTPSNRLQPLSKLLTKITPIPDDWIGGRSASTSRRGGTEIDCTVCEDWGTLINSWRKAMQWTEGLDRALSVMLASVTSTKAVGDQLWIKIMGPASSGKSTLCEALSANKKHVLAKSTIRGFHSGFKTDGKGEKDNSLIADLYDKTLVTKDGDTLLQAPNLSQILSEARDLYDSTSRTHYRHGLKRDYEGVRMTWLLCGTSSLRQIDSSELGERFLDCVIMEGIDDDLEDEILLRVANRTARGMAFESNGDLQTQYDPDLVQAMQLTGGYINHLRAVARDSLESIVASDSALRTCRQLGKFIAYMRARPSSKQEETAEREFAARLVSQIVRLAMCLAVVLGRKEIDKEVLRRVRLVALDTARGRTLEIIRHLYKAGDEGMALAAMSILTNQTEDKERVLLRFLRSIGVVEVFTKKITTALSSRPRWRLTTRLYSLYREVMQNEA